MKVKFFGFTMVVVLGWQTASAVEVSWYRQPGSAVSIAGNNSGAIWMAGTDRDGANGYAVYTWDGKEFHRLVDFMPSRRLAVNGDNLWMVDDLNRLFGTLLAGSALFNLRNASDVAVGGDNSVWIIGTDARTGGYSVYQRAGSNSWTYMDGAGVNLAVDKTGNAWVVNDTGEIHMYNIASKSWELVPGYKPGAKARCIRTGLSSGAVWMLGTDSIPGGYPIFQWNSANRTWDQYGSLAAVDITEAAGVPWIVGSDGRLYSKVEPSTSTSTSSAPVDMTLTWPAATPQGSLPTRVTRQGQLLCSDVGTYTDCTTTKADYVGKYALDTTCDEGFYDPIYGGSCWKCDPGYDGKGAYIRSLTPVDGDTACWRVPVETTGYAKKVRSPAWAWDCPSGSFWDIYSPDGIGGSCWQCPTDLPRRTLAAVYAPNACASPLNQTSRAIFLSYNGCPTPDATTMGLPGKRLPGKAFLDIAAGSKVASPAGACFACPVVDESGNFIIADRNTNSLYDISTNTGCTIKLQWKPAPLDEPGLAYMVGVKDVIWENKVFDGTAITTYLYSAAETLGKGKGTAAAKAWVTAQWNEIAATPYNNAQFRAYMFVLLKNALAKAADKRTAGEKRLIESFARYIQQRRTYLAEQALAMYDAWKLNDDTYRARTGQGRQFSSLFYYGTVPADFHGMLTGLLGMGSFGGATLGSLVAANEFINGLKVIDTAEDADDIAGNMFEMFGDLKLLQSVQGLKVVAGASIIQLAASILTGIAIDQFYAIETARSRLVASLSEAQKRVDLDVLKASDNGEDTLYLYWSKAVDVWDAEDPQVIQLAGMAQVRAEQSGYALPQN